MNNEQDKNKQGQSAAPGKSSSSQDKGLSAKQSQDSSVGGRNIRDKK